MAAMTTALNFYANNGNARTWYTTGHTIVKPKWVVATRQPQSSNATVAEGLITVVHGTEDSSGDPLKERIKLWFGARNPIYGLDTDVDAAIVIARDYVASDEYVTMVKSLVYPPDA